MKIDVADNNAVYYYHFDGLGSVIALSNENKQIIERYSYDVFGEPNRTSDVNNPYLFTGRRYDPEAGLYYYRARYYAYDIGRFLQTDPVGYRDGLNLYSYCRNNPINWIDPYGLILWRQFWRGLAKFAGGGATGLIGAGIVGGTGGTGIILGGGALMIYGSYNLGYGTSEMLMALNDIPSPSNPTVGAVQGAADMGVGVATGSPSGAVVGALEIVDSIDPFGERRASHNPRPYDWEEYMQYVNGLLVDASADMENPSVQRLLDWYGQQQQEQKPEGGGEGGQSGKKGT